MPPADLAGLQEVAVEIAVAGSVRETVALLHWLDHAPRLLIVQDVKIRVGPSGSRARC